MTRNTLCDFYLFVTINSEIADIPLDASCLSVCPSAVQHLECCLLLLVTLASDSSSSSHMRFMSHNWSATKQRLHPQSVAEISRHSVLPGDRIRQCVTSSGSCHKDTDQCLVSRHFLLQAPPCSVRKQFSRDHYC